jgi:hypothetical protein
MGGICDDRLDVEIRQVPEPLALVLGARQLESQQLGPDEALDAVPLVTEVLEVRRVWPAERTDRCGAHTITPPARARRGR